MEFLQFGSRQIPAGCKADRALQHRAGILAAVGNTPIPFSVGGPATDPVFRPDMKAVAREELKKFTGGDPAGKASSLIKGLFGNKDKKKQ